MITSRQYVQMRDMWRDGATIKEIAATVGCSKSAVGNAINTHRDEFPRRNHKTTEEDVRLMIAMNAMGASVASIARVVGCNRRTVRRRLKKVAS